MQNIVHHLETVIRPALRAYISAENRLTEATGAGDQAAVEAARGSLMLAARHAAIELSHLSDFVLHDGSGPQYTKLEALRADLQSKVQFLRDPRAPVPDDVHLLRDIADAFKHHTLNRASATVAGSGDVAAIASGWGQARWGEGKFGGVEQMMVTRKSGETRALSSVFQNVFDAWLTLLNLPLPKINDY